MPPFPFAPLTPSFPLGFADSIIFKRIEEKRGTMPVSASLRMSGHSKALCREEEKGKGAKGGEIPFDQIGHGEDADASHSPTAFPSFRLARILRCRGHVRLPTLPLGQKELIRSYVNRLS